MAPNRILLPIGYYRYPNVDSFSAAPSLRIQSGGYDANPLPKTFVRTEQAHAV